jgi:hypothetical protein
MKLESCVIPSTVADEMIQVVHVDFACLLVTITYDFLIPDDGSYSSLARSPTSVGKLFDDLQLTIVLENWACQVERNNTESRLDLRRRRGLCRRAGRRCLQHS